MHGAICVVTGASRGIGRSIALRLASAGASIVAVARNPDALRQTAAAVERLGATCLAIAADAADPRAAERATSAAAERFGKIDVLVNNAGVAPLSPVASMSDAAFEELAALNMAAVFRWTRAVWAGMAAQGGGVIINISSVASVDPFPGFAAYGASKAWVNLFTQAIAAEGRPSGIYAFSVAPGAVETEMLRGAFPDLPAAQVLDPDAVAAVVESLCAPQMSYLTGQTLFVRP